MAGRPEVLRVPTTGDGPVEKIEFNYT